MNATGPILSVRDLHKHYPVPQGWWARLRQRGQPPVVRALDGVSFDLRRGEAMGVVGEPGSGKTTLARLLLRLVEPTAGEIRFEGTVVSRLTGAALNPFRRKAQLLVQNPHDALNPRFTIYRSLVEPLLIHSLGTREERRRRIVQALHHVHVSQPEAVLDYFPHQLSGGQLLRVVLARALVLQPTLLVADEPGARLGGAVQAGILTTIRAVSQRLGITTLYLTSDPSLMHYTCDTLAILQRGRIVEIGPTQTVMEQPHHPYTQALLASATLDLRPQP